MAEALPPELAGLLNGRGPSEREEAWVDFVHQQSRLLLHVARSFGGGHDAAMNRYTYILEQLRSDDYRRLRGYTPTARCAFTTWLAIVARRLSIDHERHRFGRVPTGKRDSPDPLRTLRRRLVEGLSADVDAAQIPDSTSTDPEQSAYLAECRDALSAALGDLDPEDRLLLKLRLQDELPAPEIAELMGFPTRFHVYRRVNALCASIAKELRARGIVAPT